MDKNLQEELTVSIHFWPWKNVGEGHRLRLSNGSIRWQKNKMYKSRIFALALTVSKKIAFDVIDIEVGQGHGVPL